MCLNANYGGLEKECGSRGVDGWSVQYTDRLSSVGACKKMLTCARHFWLRGATVSSPTPTEPCACALTATRQAGEGLIEPTDRPGCLTNDVVFLSVVFGSVLCSVPTPRSDLYVICTKDPIPSFPSHTTTGTGKLMILFPHSWGCVGWPPVFSMPALPDKLNAYYMSERRVRSTK